MSSKYINQPEGSAKLDSLQAAISDQNSNDLTALTTIAPTHADGDGQKSNDYDLSGESLW